MNENKFENLNSEEDVIKILRDKVLQEMEDYKSQHLNDAYFNPSQYRIDYLNNFISNILWQEDRIKEADLSDARNWADNSSALAKSQTYGEFFAVIDEKMKEMGLDKDELRKMQQEQRLKKLEDRDFNPLVDKVLDLYIRLLAMGYNPCDLC